ncbi:MAG: zinc-binding alcohol dehydrogenase family protein [Nostocoides sp.]
MAATMSGLRFHRYGGPEVLTWDEVSVPTPEPGELRVAVRAWAVNWADLLERAGRYPGAPEPPYVTGHDLCGIVESIGDGVAQFKVGDRVFGVVPSAGAAADFACAPAYQFYPAPERLSDAEASGAAGPYLTADVALTLYGELKPGQSVLVHAAAGGFGSATVQLARAMGAGLIMGTAGTAAKAERVRSFGADIAVDYTHEDFVAAVLDATDGRGVDLVVDSVGGDVLGRSFDVIRPPGRLVSVGASAGSSSNRFRLHTLFETGISVSGFTLGKLLDDDPQLVRPSVDRVLDLLGFGAISPVVDRIFDREDARAAHEHLGGRQSVGRTVVQIATP